MDEAAHIDPNLFYKTIVPILQLKNTALLALSSPEGNENYYSELLNLKDQNGDDWFNVINKKMVCKECLKGDTAKQLACDHIKQIEPWLSHRRFERLKALYANAKGTALQELAGMVVSEYLPCFPEADIASCFAAKPVITMSSPGIVYISADPSGGGPSHLALCAGYFDATHNFVVGGPVVYSFKMCSVYNSLYILFSMLYISYPEWSIRCICLNMYGKISLKCANSSWLSW